VSENGHFVEMFAKKGKSPFLPAIFLLCPRPIKHIIPAYN